MEYALTRRTAVVLAIPYDHAALAELPARSAPRVTHDRGTDLGQVARLLAGVRRALILAGRGPHLAVPALSSASSPTGSVH